VGRLHSAPPSTRALSRHSYNVLPERARAGGRQQTDGASDPAPSASAVAAVTAADSDSTRSCWRPKCAGPGSKWVGSCTATQASKLYTHTYIHLCYTPPMLKNLCYKVKTRLEGPDAQAPVVAAADHEPVGGVHRQADHRAVVRVGGRRAAARGQRGSAALPARLGPAAGGRRASWRGALSTPQAGRCGAAA